MPVTFTNAARGEDLRADTYAALQSAVRAALGDTEEAVTVRFGVWTDEGLTRYVCKVETRPAGPFAEEQWRWWSPLFETPEELESALREAVIRRQRGDAARPGPRPTFAPGTAALA
jgi:hypothetical protein